MDRRKLSRVQFTNELSEKAFEIYSNSDYYFYELNGIYYVAVGANSTDFSEIGSIKDVNAFLED